MEFLYNPLPLNEITNYGVFGIATHEKNIKVQANVRTTRTVKNKINNLQLQKNMLETVKNNIQNMLIENHSSQTKPNSAINALREIQEHTHTETIDPFIKKEKVSDNNNDKANSNNINEAMQPCTDENFDPQLTKESNDTKQTEVDNGLNVPLLEKDAGEQLDKKVLHSLVDEPDAQELECLIKKEKCYRFQPDCIKFWILNIKGMEKIIDFLFSKRFKFVYTKAFNVDNIHEYVHLIKVSNGILPTRNHEPFKYIYMDGNMYIYCLTPNVSFTLS